MAKFDGEVWERNTDHMHENHRVPLTLWQTGETSEDHAEDSEHCEHCGDPVCLDCRCHGGAQCMCPKNWPESCIICGHAIAGDQDVCDVCISGHQLVMPDTRGY